MRAAGVDFLFLSGDHRRSVIIALIDQDRTSRPMAPRSSELLSTQRLVILLHVFVGSRIWRFAGPTQHHDAEEFQDVASLVVILIDRDCVRRRQA